MTHCDTMRNLAYILFVLILVGCDQVGTDEQTASGEWSGNGIRITIDERVGITGFGEVPDPVDILGQREADSLKMSLQSGAKHGALLVALIHPDTLRGVLKWSGDHPVKLSRQ